MTVTWFLVREMCRDRSVWYASGLLVAALLLALVNGFVRLGEQRTSLAQLERNAAEQMAALRAQGDSIAAGQREKSRGYWNDPNDVRGFGYYLMQVYATQPPRALGVLALGVSDVQPNALRVGPGSMASFASAYDIENPERLALGRLDASFVVIVLVPLVIAAVGYGALAIDREGGRLPLLAIHGVSPRRIATLRLLVRSASLAVLASVTVVAALALVPRWGGSFAEAGLWLLVALAYGAFWVGVTLCVVAATRHASTAAAVLGAVWVFVVLVCPWCVALVAETMYPTPSRVEQVLAGRAATDEASRSSGALLARYLRDHPELNLNQTEAASHQYTAQLITTANLVDARQAESDAHFDRLMTARQALVRRFAWVMPPVLAQESMTDIAGTGIERQRMFMAQTQAYVADLRRFFEPRALRSDRRFTDWNGWPRYQWLEPSSTATRGALAGVLALTVEAAILVGIARRRLAKAPVQHRTII